ncbi:lantibiotic dehydratase family protein [Tenacibaculum finnmarkense]|uniref:lantibiotic dehydratase family protein n=1 Tax=Tenacibaculum finnmarkense TaxID=2781243 RepID=UPI001E527BB9|nr:lantibiotic dehydratase family protein [Tenacibaculum finnmarkense]MCD8411507.1 lantibiotic dehydratase family protein [Tenacibaculum finnmarkense genomovar ulcerans]
MKYNFINRYVLRIPLLSLEDISSLNETSLKKIVLRKEISEAIYLASPSFHKELKKALENNCLDEKMKISLSKYIIRMGFRCTPFGLFSGCDIGNFSKKSYIKLDEINNYKRVSRFDMNFLCALVQEIEKDEELRKKLLYFPNSTLSEIGFDFRYVEYKYIDNKRKHFISSVEANTYLKEVLKKAKEGQTIEELSIILTSFDEDIKKNEAINYIKDLINNQILVSDISPTVSGEDYFERILRKVDEIEKYNWLKKLKLEFDSIDNQYGVDKYLKLYKILDSNNISYNQKYLVQTDLIVNTSQNTISYKTLKKIRKGLTVLNKLKHKKTNSNLEYFKNKFIERFNDELVPLSLALDVENGIGFSKNNYNSEHYDISNLTDDLEYPFEKEEKEKISYPEKIIQRLMLRTLEKGEKELVLTDKDLEGLEEKWDDFPKTMSGMIKVLDDSENPKIFMNLFAGPTASLLLGRFGHVDEKFHSLIYEIFDIEKTKNNLIPAEIIHLPEDRLGNILIRKNQRNYEIPYLAFSTLPRDKQLNMSDLCVAVKEDRVVLFSKKLNKEILPFNSNAHDYSNSMPIYNFLSNLQTQNLYGFLSLNLGNLQYRYIPRISYENIIFSPAQWNIYKNEIHEIINDIDKWIKDYGIPQFIVFFEDDNELLIDLNNNLSIKVFKSLLKNKQQIIFKEFLFNNNFLVKDKKNKGYCNEIIVSIEI